MNISTTPKHNNQKLPAFIKHHVRWKGLDETPEWRSFATSWSAGESRVAATALDVIGSHFRDRLSRSERSLLCAISDSLLGAIYRNSQVA